MAIHTQKYTYRVMLPPQQCWELIAKLTCILHLASFMLLSFNMLIDPFHTTAAKVDILNFKSFLLELQKHSQTADARGEAGLRIYNLKKTSPTQSQSQAVVCVSTPRMYPRSGYFLVIN